MSHTPRDREHTEPETFVAPAAKRVRSPVSRQTLLSAWKGQPSKLMTARMVGRRVLKTDNRHRIAASELERMTDSGDYGLFELQWHGLPHPMYCLELPQVRAGPREVRLTTTPSSIPSASSSTSSTSTSSPSSASSSSTSPPSARYSSASSTSSSPLLSSVSFDTVDRAGNDSFSCTPSTTSESSTACINTTYTPIPVLPSQPCWDDLGGGGGLYSSYPVGQSQRPPPPSPVLDTGSVGAGFSQFWPMQSQSLARTMQAFPAFSQLAPEHKLPQSQWMLRPPADAPLSFTPATFTREDEKVASSQQQQFYSTNIPAPTVSLPPPPPPPSQQAPLPSQPLSLQPQPQLQLQPAPEPEPPAPNPLQQEVERLQREVERLQREVEQHRQAAESSERRVAELELELTQQRAKPERIVHRAHRAIAQQIEERDAACVLANSLQAQVVELQTAAKEQSRRSEHERGQLRQTIAELENKASDDEMEIITLTVELQAMRQAMHAMSAPTSGAVDSISSGGSSGGGGGPSANNMDVGS